MIIPFLSDLLVDEWSSSSMKESNSRVQT